MAVVGSGQWTVPGHASPGRWGKAAVEQGGLAASYVWPKQASKRGKVKNENTLSAAYLNKERRGKVPALMLQRPVSIRFRRPPRSHPLCSFGSQRQTQPYKIVRGEQKPSTLGEQTAAAPGPADQRGGEHGEQPGRNRHREPRAAGMALKTPWHSLQ